MRTPEERPRPAIWGPVLIAAVFLAIIGGSVGWVLGARGNEASATGPDVLGPDAYQREPVQPSPFVPAAEPTPSAVDTGDNADNGGTGGYEPASGGAKQTANSDDCPDVTARHAAEAGARGGLTLVIYIHTDLSEAWVCSDSRHNLFYQGHRGPPGEKLDPGTNALFLVDVEDKGEYYLAINHNNGQSIRYRVNRKELVIESAAGEERQAVLDFRE